MQHLTNINLAFSLDTFQSKIKACIPTEYSIFKDDLSFYVTVYWVVCYVNSSTIYFFVE